MINIPDDIKNLIKEYEKQNNEKPRGWNYKEETLTEYKNYLEKEINYEKR